MGEPPVLGRRAERNELERGQNGFAAVRRGRTLRPTPQCRLTPKLGRTMPSKRTAPWKSFGSFHV